MQEKGSKMKMRRESECSRRERRNIRWGQAKRTRKASSLRQNNNNNNNNKMKKGAAEASKTAIHHQSKHQRCVAGKACNDTAIAYFL
jgi:hypothetical protein